MGSSLEVFKTISIWNVFRKKGTGSIEAATIFGGGVIMSGIQLLCKFVFIQLISSVNCLSKFFCESVNQLGMHTSLC